MIRNGKSQTTVQLGDVSVALADRKEDSNTADGERMLEGQPAPPATPLYLHVKRESSASSANGTGFVGGAGSGQCDVINLD